ncbi:hypothetical protein HF521_016073 [Silurus meridionalis]|uniref:Ig-like domain-containing protein n=1 Tax=Silurus meridionalis TaxID=175797 RepID=A0A8T0BS36_SILME|nr:hypothetical protein HF521_016073 [Silurus meridionalis]
MCSCVADWRVILFVISSCTRVRAIKVIGQDVNVTEGDDAQLFCQAVETSDKLTSITWQRRTNENRETKTSLLLLLMGKKDN